MIDAELAAALDLLRKARQLSNQTVRDAREVAVWRRKLDDMLSRYPHDDPAERYDTPERVEYRNFVDRLFFRKPPRKRQWER